jgi:F-type H+-transporting ATPase subunit alpha
MDAPDLKTSLQDTAGVMDGILHSHRPEIRVDDVGTVSFVGQGIVRVTGLRGVQSEELIGFSDDLLGMAFNLDEKETGVILMDESTALLAGSEARRTGRVMDIPVGEALLGRVLDAKGRPLDGGEPIDASERRPVEQPAPSIMDRAPVTVPLQTGLKVVDALIPIGRGQRELILGDRQTGKTAIALDTVINQKDKAGHLHLLRRRKTRIVGRHGDRRPAGPWGHGLFHRGGGHGGKSARAAVHRPLCGNDHRRVFHAAGQRCARGFR